MKEFLTIEQLVNAIISLPIDNVAGVSDGNHFSISESFIEKGVPYYRGQDVVGNFFVEQSNPNQIDALAYHHKHMERSHLKKGDVLLSIIGTIGELSLVCSEEPATCSCKLAILRPKTILAEYLAIFLKSKFGAGQIQRFKRGAVQMGLLLEDMDQILVVRLSNDFEHKVADIVSRARAILAKETEFQVEAEQTLLRALGLENWLPPEPLSYTRKASEVWEAERLDADYYAPQKQAAIDKLATPGSRPLRDYCDSIRDMVDPTRATPQKLVRNFDLTDALNPVLDDEMEPVLLQSVGSMKKRFRPGDVVISRLRAYLKEIAVVRTSGEIDAVGSSEFIVLRPTENTGQTLTPETLSIFLRSMPVQLILQYCQDGSHHPRFSESDLLAIPVPEIVFSLSAQLDAQLNAALSARHRAAELLERAKRAVEIAIEESEAAALAYLEG